MHERYFADELIDVQLKKNIKIESNKCCQQELQHGGSLAYVNYFRSFKSCLTDYGIEGYSRPMLFRPMLFCPYILANGFAPP